MINYTKKLENIVLLFLNEEDQTNRKEKWQVLLETTAKLKQMLEDGLSANEKKGGKSDGYF